MVLKSVKANKKLSVKNRRDRILEILDEKTEVKITDLSNILDTSVVTIRKDLEFLEHEGLLMRIHGGAINNYRAYQNKLYNAKINIKKEEKTRIAKAAVGFIEEGESVIINVGSTSSFVAKEIKKLNNLTVITNSVQIFNELGYCKNIICIFLGGRFDADIQVTYGEDTSEQLSKYYADKLIMGMDGVDIKNGITSYAHIAFPITKQMITSAKERYLIVDDSKIGNTALVHIANITDFDTIITNETDKTAPVLAEIESMGIKIVRV